MSRAIIKLNFNKKIIMAEFDKKKEMLVFRGSAPKNSRSPVNSIN
jgi:hypothetical protein